MNLDAFVPAFLALCMVGLGTYYLKSIDHQMAAQARRRLPQRSRATYKRWGAGMIGAGVVLLVLAGFQALAG